MSKDANNKENRNTNKVKSNSKPTSAVKKVMDENMVRLKKIYKF